MKSLVFWTLISTTENVFCKQIFNLIQTVSKRWIYTVGDKYSEKTLYKYSNSASSTKSDITFIYM